MNDQNQGFNGPDGMPTPPPPPNYYLTPGSNLLSESSARNVAMLIHLAALACSFFSGGFLGFVAPLVIWLIYRDRAALVDFHGKQNMNLQITIFIGGIVTLVLTLITLGLGALIFGPLYLLYLLYGLIIMIVAAVKGSQGEAYRIPLVIRFLR